ncbi:hypothetical protein POM88_043670 [Heracleum sosnowskyi]|uniref:Uncharacterized protein n=1 Tax=Heracleum sosnowskyi TaxID=360622 RepID=A0AAD8H2D8_9APIA|nr:hypothetical protein POM88_043670 [Heracleum sosnowskyi]
MRYIRTESQLDRKAYVLEAIQGLYKDYKCNLHSKEETRDEHGNVPLGLRDRGLSHEAKMVEQEQKTMKGEETPAGKSGYCKDGKKQAVGFLNLTRVNSTVFGRI